MPTVPVFLWETEFCYVTPSQLQNVYAEAILLPQPLRCWDCNSVSLGPAYCFFYGQNCPLESQEDTERSSMPIGPAGPQPC